MIKGEEFDEFKSISELRKYVVTMTKRELLKFCDRHGGGTVVLVSFKPESHKNGPDVREILIVPQVLRITWSEIETNRAHKVGHATKCSLGKSVNYLEKV